MNKVQQINLGGVPFTIDEDAYEHLSSYLRAIHRHFEASEGYEEITHDIEARMAELFQENLGSRTIVTRKDVEDAIVIMGTPEDFGAEAITEEEEETTQRHTKYRTGKRLFLNPDDEVVGGVCSGIAAYFGIADPLWIRLAFIIITISGGFGIPAYLILWVILPKAESASDRLAMRGEPINVSNIGKIIEEEVENISHKVSEFGSELSGKKKERNGQGGLGEILRQGISLLGKAIRAVIEVISQLWKPLVIIIGGAFILISAITWIATVIGIIFSWPVLEFFTPQWPLLSVLGVVNVLAIVGMIMLALVLFVTRLLYGTRMSSPWRAGLTGFWILNLVSFFFVLSFILRDFGRTASVESVEQLNLTTDTLRLEMGEGYEADGWFNIDDEFKLVREGLASDMVNIHLEKAEGNQFEIFTEASARGQDSDKARTLAQSIDYSFQIENGVLTIPAELITPNGQKWRAQKVDVTLKIPVGKAVLIAESANRHIQTAQKADRSIMIYRNPNKVWTMTEEGLFCEACAKTDHSPTSTDQQNFMGFSEVQIQGPIKVHIEQDKDFNISLLGEREAREQVKMTQEGNILTISTGETPPSSTVRLNIEMPYLKALHTDFTDNVSISDFQGQRLDITTKGHNKLRADVEVDSLILTQTGGQQIRLVGAYGFVKAEMSNGGVLLGNRAEVRKAMVKARNGSRIEMDDVAEIEQDIDESSEVNW